tara:strand:+ start:656 stop:1045 length:390 start_codon:yes stop_codon:yes gene_type:complete
MKYQTRNKRAKKSKKRTKRNMKAGMNGRHDALGPMIYGLQPSSPFEPETFEPIQSIQEPSYPTKPILPTQPETQPLAPPVSLPLERQQKQDNIHENPMISLVAKEANRQLSWCVMNQTIVNATILPHPA